MCLLAIQHKLIASDTSQDVFADGSGRPAFQVGRDALDDRVDGGVLG